MSCWVVFPVVLFLVVLLLVVLFLVVHRVVAQMTWSVMSRVAWGIMRNGAGCYVHGDSDTALAIRFLC